jgi:hypothetical protein
MATNTSNRRRAAHQRCAQEALMVTAEQRRSGRRGRRRA